MIVIVMADKVATGSDGVIVEYFKLHGRHCKTWELKKFRDESERERLQARCDRARTAFLKEAA